MELKDDLDIKGKVEVAATMFDGHDRARIDEAQRSRTG